MTTSEESHRYWQKKFEGHDGCCDTRIITKRKLQILEKFGGSIPVYKMENKDPLEEAHDAEAMLKVLSATPPTWSFIDVFKYFSARIGSVFWCQTKQSRKVWDWNRHKARKEASIQEAYRRHAVWDRRFCKPFVSMTVIIVLSLRCNFGSHVHAWAHIWSRSIISEGICTLNILCQQLIATNLFRRRMQSSRETASWEKVLRANPLWNWLANHARFQGRQLLPI